MKRVIVQGSFWYGDTRLGSSNDGLLRKYPVLEYLKLIYIKPKEPDELKKNFELNSNVRTFATNARILDFDGTKAVGLNLDVLAIYTDEGLDMSIVTKQLSQMGFYKRLHLYLDEPLTNQLSAVEKLHFYFGNIRHFIPLINLKELNISCSDRFLKNNIIENFVCLERVSLEYARPTHILALIGGLEKLKQLRVSGLNYDLVDGPKKNILDLLAWNNEREKLAEAKRGMVYVPESVFLATKWATHQTRFSLVELKRDSCKNWNHDIYHY